MFKTTTYGPFPHNKVLESPNQQTLSLRDYLKNFKFLLKFLKLTEFQFFNTVFIRRFVFMILIRTLQTFLNYWNPPPPHCSMSC